MWHIETTYQRTIHKLITNNWNKALYLRTIMARACHEPSSSSSPKRNFKWIMRRGRDSARRQCKEEEEKASSSHPPPEVATASARKKTSAAAVAVSRLRSVLATAVANRQNRSSTRMTGTLYGHRRGHVHLAFQVDSRSCPVALLEIATSTSSLVREMASGLVRIALECEQRTSESNGKGGRRLLEEPLWLAYCNGRKCGYAVKRECVPADWKVLKAIEAVSMGAGVLPGHSGCKEPEGEVMYMRAKFERVVGSRDSEAFYMMNPDGNGGTELSIYFLRVCL